MDEVNFVVLSVGRQSFHSSASPPPAIHPGSLGQQLASSRRGPSLAHSSEKHSRAHYLSTGWGLENKTAPHCCEWEWFNSIQEWVKGENPLLKPNNFCLLFTKSLKCEWGSEPKLLQSRCPFWGCLWYFFGVTFCLSILIFKKGKKKPALVFNSPCHDAKGQTPAVLPKPLGEAWLHLVLVNLDSSSSKSLSLTLTCPGNRWLETGEVEKSTAKLCPLQKYIIWQKPFQHVEGSGTGLPAWSSARLQTYDFTSLFVYDFPEKIKVRASWLIRWQYLGPWREASVMCKTALTCGVLWWRYILTDMK